MSCAEGATTTVRVRYTYQQNVSQTDPACACLFFAVPQGHRNVITCCAVSADKRWVVTADAGPDSLLAVWDSVSGKGASCCLILRQINQWYATTL